MSKHGIKVIQILLRMTLTAAVSICSLLDLPSSLCACVCAVLVHLSVFKCIFLSTLCNIISVTFIKMRLKRQSSREAFCYCSHCAKKKNESVMVHTDLTFIYRYEQLSR